MFKKKFKEISTIEVNRENYEKSSKEKNTIFIFKK